MLKGMDPTEEELYEKLEVEVVPCTPEKAQVILRRFAEVLVAAWIGEQKQLAEGNGSAVDGAEDSLPGG